MIQRIAGSVYMQKGDPVFTGSFDSVFCSGFIAKEVINLTTEITCGLVKHER